jgi:hypothetical protein
MDNFDKAFEAAKRRGAERLAKYPAAIEAKYDRRIGRVYVVLKTGLAIAFNSHEVQGLEHAKPEDMSEIEISPSGHGLHFPKLDVDIYLPSLMDGYFGTKAWMAQRLGQIGGKAKSDAKSSAARANGARGGRPRKVVADKELEPA